MTSTPQHHLSANKRIIVCGGGVGGPIFCIALEQFLHKHDQLIQSPPSIDVYERETAVDITGREGYSLAIRDGAGIEGLQTLQKLDMLDEIVAEGNPTTRFTIFNADFTIVKENNAPPIEGLRQASLRIARTKLREILMKHMPSSVTIHWDCSITSAQELENGKVLVELANGSQEQCDFLIVADGSKSKIRRILRPQHEATFNGTVSITARTHPLEKWPPPLDVARGRVLCGNGNLAFIAAADQKSLLWSVSYQSDTPRDDRAAGTMNDVEIDKLLAEAKERTKNCSEPMPTLLKQTLRSSLAIFNAQEVTPFRNHGSVIFIGDAQHAMSIFGGSGANLAIMDGYLLAEQLVNSNSFIEAMKAYDDQAVPRSTEAMKMSRQIIGKYHSQSK